MVSIRAAIRNEMARSNFGSRARARAGGRLLDRGFFGEAVILRAPSSSGGAMARAGVAPAALRNGSGGENERVACGNTVLLSRSLAGFFTARFGATGATGSVFTGVKRAVSFLKRSRNGIVIVLMVLRRYSPHFFQRGHALERLLNSDHPQSFHSFSDRLIFDHRSGRALDDQTPDRFAHRKCFNYCRTTEIAASFASVASGPLVKNHPFVVCLPELLDQFRFGNEFFLTIGADAPNESLR